MLGDAHPTVSGKVAGSRRVGIAHHHRRKSFPANNIIGFRPNSRPGDCDGEMEIGRFWIAPRNFGIIKAELFFFQSSLLCSRNSNFCCAKDLGMLREIHE